MFHNDYEIIIGQRSFRTQMFLGILQVEASPFIHPVKLRHQTKLPREHPQNDFFLNPLSSPSPATRGLINNRFDKRRISSGGGVRHCR